MRCGLDGVTYVGSRGRDEVRWYRCNGQLVERGPLPGRCWGQSIRTEAIEPQVWGEIEGWLRDPGAILAELEKAASREAATELAVAESVTLTHSLEALEAQRKRALGLNIRGWLPDAELDQ